MNNSSTDQKSSIEFSSSDDLNEILNRDSNSLIDSYDRRWPDSPLNGDHDFLKICGNSDKNSTDPNLSRYGYTSAVSNRILDSNTVLSENYNDEKLKDFLSNDNSENSPNNYIDPIPIIDDSISNDYRTLNVNQILQGEVCDQTLPIFISNDYDNSMILGNCDNILIHRGPNMQDNTKSDDIFNIDSSILVDFNDESMQNFLSNNDLGKSIICGISNFDKLGVSRDCHQLNKTESDHIPNGRSNRDEDTKGIDYLFGKCMLSRFNREFNRNKILGDNTLEIMDNIKVQYETLFGLVYLEDKTLDSQFLNTSCSFKEGKNYGDLELLKHKRSNYK
ncbi:MAG: hypothetical protein MHMPM18_003357 [Marteilia pararefringens]